MNRKNLLLLTSALSLLLILGGVLVAAAPPAHALESVIDPEACDPSSSALGTGQAGCGLDDFESVLKRIIRIILYLIVPVAAIFIIWGGFVIMTAGGSSEKVQSGKKKIITAVTGIVIVLIAYLIVQFVFNVLEVTPDFRPGSSNSSGGSF